MQNQYKCGFIAIVGKPNTGKSTLLNALIGQKVSITSRKAQTTRHQIIGIHTNEIAQCVFVDTPGFQTRHKSALNSQLNKTVNSSIGDVDLILMVIQAGQFNEQDELVLQLIHNVKQPVILICNKLDTISFENKPQLLPFIDKVSKQAKFEHIIPMSAKTPAHVERLLELVTTYLPEQEKIYADDEITDKSVRFLVSEIIREKIFRLNGDELPYKATVVIDKYEESKRFCKIYATILVEKTSHKAMIIGSNGEKLKQIGSQARADIEKLLGHKIYLETWVKVKDGWADNEAGLRAYGYE